MPGKRGTQAERFWSKVDQRGPNECWPWIAYVDPTKGYGQFGRGKRGEGIVSSNRMAYELTYGPIPDGMHVDHTCHNNSDCDEGIACEHRKCCNPKHLEAITQPENTSRGNAGKYQTLKTHCPYQHEYTPENTFDNNGGRGCKECRRRWNKTYQEKRKAK